MLSFLGTLRCDVRTSNTHPSHDRDRKSAHETTMVWVLDRGSLTSKLLGGGPGESTVSDSSTGSNPSAPGTVSMRSGVTGANGGDAAPHEKNRPTELPDSWRGVPIADHDQQNRTNKRFTFTSLIVGRLATCSFGLRKATSCQRAMDTNHRSTFCPRFLAVKGCQHIDPTSRNSRVT